MTRDGFHTITLGCKLNQFDSAAIEAELTRRGLPRETDPARARVVILNTCTVTARADADARKWIRRVRRSNPGCRLLVTGCLAERDPQAIAAAGRVDHVFGNRDKPEIGRILDGLGIGRPNVRPASSTAVRPDAGDRGCDGPARLPDAVSFGERSRAFLKVQEGCNLACSYCIIPQVRGPSRSVPPDRVVAAARAVMDAGYREVVLTGVNTGDYGRDLTPRIGLVDLLRVLLVRCAPARIRLNSLEPLTVTRPIVDLMAADPRLAPHLQIPLQSGSQAILRRMRRNYTLATYLERLRQVRAAIPHACLGADVIVGFPGETDTHFDETRRFIEDSPLDYLHVFSWSERTGTPAARLDERVPAGTVRARTACLRTLGADRFHRFRRRFEGKALEAVVLGARPSDGRTRALTGNFIEVLLEDESAPRGDLVIVRVTSAERDETRGRLEGRPPWASDPAGLRASSTVALAPPGR